MILLTPLGLLGLLGIIALIIIYILKPKYQDKTLSSTFIWKLSLKYKKQRIPLEWLKSSLIFILQVLIITIMTIIMANPNITFASESGEKVVILDASASMMAEVNGETRFNRAIKEINTLIEETTPKDRFTVILSGSTASFVVRRSDNEEFIKGNLTSLEPSYSISNIEQALDLAETVLEENPTAEIYYFTSMDYQTHDGIIVRNMSQSEWNAAVLDFKAIRGTNGRYYFEAEIGNYGEARSFAVQLKVDGLHRGATLVNFAKDEVKLIKWDAVSVLSYIDAEVLLDIEDSFTYDNHLGIYDGLKDEFKIQLISDNEDEFESTLYFVKQALTAVNSRFKITQPVNEAEYKTEGFDLYVYSGYVPNVLPIDGAIWFFNPKLIPTGTGITLSNEVSGNFNVTPQNASSEIYRTFMKSIQANTITVSKYVKIQTYPLFERILNIGNDPVLLTKNHNGVKMTIFAFDLAYSNLPVQVNFPLLINNLATYSLIPTFDRYLYNAEETIEITAKPSAQTLIVSTPDGIETFDDAKVSYKLSKPGLYTVTQTLENGTVLSEKFFVRVPKDESRFNLQGTTIIKPLVPVGDPLNYQTVDLMDFIPYLAMILIGFILVEWVVQYREQY